MMLHLRNTLVIQAKHQQNTLIKYSKQDLKQPTLIYYNLMNHSPFSAEEE